MKRLFDIVASAFGLVVTCPLLLALGLWVRLDSKGPAMFRQTRVGRDGETFEIHKLRTMRKGIPGPSVTVGEDPRITRSGKFLRRTKLDELPQLIDVLVGNMSLVGPRPEVPEYVALWPEPERSVVLSVRPGITDPTALSLIDEGDVLAAEQDPEAYYREILTPIKVAGYVNYISQRTLLSDISILLSTVAASVKGGGSHG